VAQTSFAHGLCLADLPVSLSTADPSDVFLAAAPAGYLPDRWRPPWFGYLLAALFALAILLPLFGTLWNRDRDVVTLEIGVVVAPLFVPGVDYYSGDQAQMLGLPLLFREDDIAPLSKVLAQPASRCAQRDTAGETPGFEFYVYRCDQRPAHRALIYRDSMAIPLIPLLAENFASRASCPRMSWIRRWSNESTRTS